MGTYEKTGPTTRAVTLLSARNEWYRAGGPLGLPLTLITTQQGFVSSQRSFGSSPLSGSRVGRDRQTLNFGRFFRTFCFRETLAGVTEAA